MPANNDRVGLDELILSPAEAGRRLEALAALQAGLAAAGVRCLLARKHRLVLRYNSGPLEPSGLTDPQLHIFTPGGKDTATTDGLVYRLASGKEFPADDPSAATAQITGARQALPPA